MCLSLGGLLIHMKIHPVNKSLYFLWASPVNIFSFIVLPILFIRPSTVAWGFIFNAFTVGIGTIGMAYFSVLTFEPPFSLFRLLSESTLPAIVILWAKIPLAMLILQKIRTGKPSNDKKDVS